MSSDIRGLVDRTFREYLEPMDSLESYTYLTTGIGTTETTIAYDGDLLSIEEEDALDAGAELLPNEVKELMSKVAKVMTDTSYHI